MALALLEGCHGLHGLVTSWTRVFACLLVHDALIPAAQTVRNCLLFTGLILRVIASCLWKILNLNFRISPWYGYCGSFGRARRVVVIRSGGLLDPVVNFGAFRSTYFMRLYFFSPPELSRVVHRSWA